MHINRLECRGNVKGPSSRGFCNKISGWYACVRKAFWTYGQIFWVIPQYIHSNTPVCVFGRERILWDNFFREDDIFYWFYFPRWQIFFPRDDKFFPRDDKFFSPRRQILFPRRQNFSSRWQNFPPRRQNFFSEMTKLFPWDDIFFPETKFFLYRR